ncbi:MAG: hypothetical protein U5L72_20125 [Bacteroidales bacterium]|nr:hypothetical protein [Bacteroidales bacterium]
MNSFYGTAYASGYAGIRGNDQKLAFNISARTESNTEFFVPLNSSATVNDYPYIIFIDSNQKTEEDQGDPGIPLSDRITAAG